MSEGTQEKTTAKKIMPGRVRSQESVRRWWCVTVEPNVTREDMSRPEFWTLVSRTFRHGDRIEVHCDDGSFFAELLVKASDPLWGANVKELRFVDLNETSEDLSGMTDAQRRQYYVKFNGIHLMHCVERKVGDKVERLAEKMKTKGEAETWLSNYLKQLGLMAA